LVRIWSSTLYWWMSRRWWDQINQHEMRQTLKYPSIPFPYFCLPACLPACLFESQEPSPVACSHLTALVGWIGWVDVGTRVLELFLEGAKTAHLLDQSSTTGKGGGFHEKGKAWRGARRVARALAKVRVSV